MYKKFRKYNKYVPEKIQEKEETTKREEYLESTNNLQIQKLENTVIDSTNINEIQTLKTYIPLNIFQTWNSKQLSKDMKQSVDTIKNNNPEFKHYLFDDNDCREFIKNTYLKDVLTAYDKLIPGAYKADLWRYCILYKYGGIYIDIKYKMNDNVKLIDFVDSEHWVSDGDYKGIYNGFLVCLPGNIILQRAICEIISHTKIGYYGKNDLEPTGPKLLYRLYEEEDKQKVDMHHTHDKLKDRCIKHNEQIILSAYENHASDMDNHSTVPHYSRLWNENKIYRK